MQCGPDGDSQMVVARWVWADDGKGFALDHPFLAEIFSFMAVFAEFGAFGTDFIARFFLQVSVEAGVGTIAEWNDECFSAASADECQWVGVR